VHHSALEEDGTKILVQIQRVLKHEQESLHQKRY
jgi:hypothetical protein